MTRKYGLHKYLQFGLAGLLGWLMVSIFTAKTQAQQSNIIPDNTLGADSSQVSNFQGRPIEVITGGSIHQINLFHSFKEFNVSAGRGAYFFIPNGNIQNVFARVTGANRSEILGVLGTYQILNGNIAGSNANLFLINPNGIIFGQNASLDVQGSFMGTTANGVQFGNQGNFSATNPEPAPLLTINPSALFFNQINKSAAIQNNSVARAGRDPAGFNAYGLRVPDGKSLLLVGGNVSMNGGELNAYGGRVELGGLAAPGNVNLLVNGDNLSLKFPENVTRADVLLTNQAAIYVEAAGGGDIAINARNLNILAGSKIFAGIDGGLSSANSQAGDITVNASGTVRLESGSSIRNDVNTNKTGNSGNVNITTGSLFVLSDSVLTSRTSGFGNAGNVIINARDRVVFSGDDTTVDSTVRLTGRGKAGDIRISTNTLEMFDGAQLLTSTLGIGSAGDIVIEAGNRVSLTGNRATNFSNTGIFSSLGANNNSQAEGKGGEINISTKILELSNGAQLSSSTFGIGDAGNIVIKASDRATFKDDDTVLASRVERTGIGRGGDIRIYTNTLEVSNDAQINASTLNSGDAGNILIEARDKASFNNAYVFNSVWGRAIGQGGDIRINTGKFNLTNGAALSTITYGKGNAGNITIEAKDNISLGRGSRLLSQVRENAVGRGGDIGIYTNSLLLNAAELNASTSGTGDAGNITIYAPDTVSADSAIITSTVEETGFGKGGNISISTGSFTFTDSLLATGTLGDGNAGNVVINAYNTASIDAGYIFSSVEAGAIGQGGDINISTGKLSLTNGGRLTAATDGTGKAGNVVIEARDRILLDGTNPDKKNFNSAIFSSVGKNGIGQGGDIRISTGTLSLTNGAQIIATTRGKGNAGNVQIRASDAVNIAGSTTATGRPSAILAFTESDNLAGNINVETSAFRISEGAVLDSRTIASENGGNITINANTFEALNGGQLQASTDGSGQAGKITVNASDRVIISGSDPIFFERVALLPDIGRRYNPDSGLYARSGGSGIAGDINVNSGSLSLLSGGQIQVSTFGQGSAGNVLINARDFVTMDGASTDGWFPSGIFSQVFNPQVVGKGGNIEIRTGSLALSNGAQLNAATYGKGDAGDITIDAKNSVSFNGTSQDNRYVSGAFSTVELGGEGNGGNLNIRSASLSVTGGAQLQTGTRNIGDAGNIIINARDFVLFDGTTSTRQIWSSAFSSVEQGAVGKGGNIEINTGILSLSNNARLIASNNGGEGNGGDIRINTASLSLTGNTQIRASTQGKGDTGNIFINASDRISLDNGAIISNIVGNVSSPGRFGNGKGGLIWIDTGSLSVANGSQLQASTFGTGDAGDIIINARENISFQGFINSGNRIFNSAAFSIVADNSTGNGGNIRVNTGSLFVEDGAEVSVSTSGLGRAGNIAIDARDAVVVDGISRVGFASQLSTATEDDASGRGGTITVNTNSFRVSNGGFLDARTTSAFRGGDVTINANNFAAIQGGRIITTATNQGQAGNITLNADSINISGRNQRNASGLFANTTSDASGRGGNIQINARQLNVSDRAQVSVNSQGSGVAGNIDINANTVKLSDRASIIAETASQDGGSINITAQDLLLMRYGSQISTTAGLAKSGGNGGNININAKFIVAVPNENSDISANAFLGSGGNIEINSQGIFGIEARPKPTQKSDITASSELGISGVVNIKAPDTSSIINSFAELFPTIDTNALIADSCIVRGDKRQENSFTITGSGALNPNRPGVMVSNYTTGEVRGVVATSRPWQKGDPIIEATGVYRLSNGQILLSRECSS